MNSISYTQVQEMRKQAALDKTAAPGGFNIGGVLDAAINTAKPVANSVGEGLKSMAGKALNDAAAKATASLGKVPATGMLGKATQAGTRFGNNAAAYMANPDSIGNKLWSAAKVPLIAGTAGTAGMVAGTTLGSHVGSTQGLQQGIQQGTDSTMDMIGKRLQNRSSWETFMDFIKKLFGGYDSKAITNPAAATPVAAAKK